MAKAKTNKKPTKVTKDELANIQEKVSKLNTVQMQLGGIEIQKLDMIKLFQEAQQSLFAVQASLKDKYGDVSVSLTDGSLNEVKDEQVNTKN